MEKSKEDMLLDSIELLQQQLDEQGEALEQLQNALLNEKTGSAQSESIKSDYDLLIKRLFQPLHNIEDVKIWLKSINKTLSACRTCSNSHYTMEGFTCLLSHSDRETTTCSNFTPHQDIEERGRTNLRPSLVNMKKFRSEDALRVNLYPILSTGSLKEAVEDVFFYKEDGVIDLNELLEAIKNAQPR